MAYEIKLRSEKYWHIYLEHPSCWNSKFLSSFYFKLISKNFLTWNVLFWEDGENIVIAKIKIKKKQTHKQTNKQTKHDTSTNKFGGSSLSHTLDPPLIQMYFTCIGLALIGMVYIISLTAHNWQKWKRAFPTCPCHKIYRDEAAGLKSCKYTWKITIFVKMWSEIWGNIVKIWYFVNNCLIEARILKFFCTCVTHIIVIIWSTADFVSTQLIFS